MTSTGSTTIRGWVTTLYSNPEDYNNVAVGSGTLSGNGIGDANVAVEVSALELNTTGHNTATGHLSLYNEHHRQLQHG
ncbi:MAG TPA: hypothetical protein VGI60_12095 [Chthoniobacterales bacterium]